MPYEPTPESLSAHPVPAWYQDAKLGVFVHWGPYSVPAWAPESDGSEAYAEWYPYYMHVEGSRTSEYHRETYGGKSYLDFAREWSAEQFDPEAWADLFADIGARYVVLTGEHHDGFPLWPSQYTEYDAASLGPERDIVGEVCDAVRERGLKFAASYHANLNYYQPGFEGAFGHPAYDGSEPFVDTDPGPEYVDFMNAKHRELIRRYEPDLLWFDTPQADADQLRARELIADYYERAEAWGKEVAVNDRSSTDADALAGFEQDESGTIEGDFATPEYTAFEEAKPFAWETCRGIGRSFGYNSREGSEDHLEAGELVRLFVDVVSKNGNLLINVGPRADGTIPALQREPLEGLGAWLDASGEAMYGSRPAAVSEGMDGDVRFTRKDGTLYATALSWPDALVLDPNGEQEFTDEVSLLRADGTETYDASVNGGFRARLPETPPEEHPGYAYAFNVGKTK